MNQNAHNAPQSGTLKVSLRDVAERAGVSRMTVSRALREGTKISPSLRARVCELAASMGYRSDRMVSEVMTSFVRRRTPAFRETLAVFWWKRWQLGVIPEHEYFFRELKAGLISAAERHGCVLDEMLVPVGGSRSSLVMRRQLEARGISGLVMTPPLEQGVEPPDLDWKQMAVVAIGSSLQKPGFHRAQHNHYAAMAKIMEEIASRGYRRPALLTQPNFARRAYLGAFLAWGGAPEWVCPDAYQIASLRSWLRYRQPDVLIAETEELLQKIIAKKWIPHGTAMVSLDVHSVKSEFSGIYKDTRFTAACAVDLLMQARMQRETGLPTEPLSIMNEGIWVNGQTLPPRLTRVSR